MPPPRLQIRAQTQALGMLYIIYSPKCLVDPSFVTFSNSPLPTLFPSDADGLIVTSTASNGTISVQTGISPTSTPLNIAAVIGGSLGGSALVVLLIAFFVLRRRSKRKPQRTLTSVDERTHDGNQAYSYPRTSISTTDSVGVTVGQSLGVEGKRMDPELGLVLGDERSDLYVHGGSEVAPPPYGSLTIGPEGRSPRSTSLLI